MQVQLHNAVLGAGTRETIILFWAGSVIISHPGVTSRLHTTLWGQLQWVSIITASWQWYNIHTALIIINTDRDRKHIVYMLHDISIMIMIKQYFRSCNSVHVIFVVPKLIMYCNKFSVHLLIKGYLPLWLIMSISYSLGRLTTTYIIHDHLLKITAIIKIIIIGDC